MNDIPQNNIIIYSTVDGKSNISLLAKDGTVWLNQNQMAELFNTSKQNISLHINNVLKDKELQENSVVKEYLTTASDGKNYSIAFYSLEMIIAVGFRVRSPRGTQFRQWANHNLAEYMRKGFVMDDERLKNPDGRPDYFDELLERIRDIRASEKRFYQKVRDLFALSSDYEKDDKATQMFFAETNVVHAPSIAPCRMIVNHSFKKLVLFSPFPFPACKQEKRFKSCFPVVVKKDKPCGPGGWRQSATGARFPAGPPAGRPQTPSPGQNRSGTAGQTGAGGYGPSGAGFRRCACTCHLPA